MHNLLCQNIVQVNDLLETFERVDKLCACDETFTALKKVLKRMLGGSGEEANLKRTVDVPAENGDGHDALKVEWHLCSDHKLVALFGGFEGSGSNKPCFVCNWDRTDPFHETERRMLGDILKKSEWAQKYLKPLSDAQAKVCRALDMVRAPPKAPAVY
jgi:hypothetical protein